jgi:hypothetical protein
MNAMRLPSGDHEGRVGSKPRVVENRFGRVPSAATEARLASGPSERTNTIRRLLGDHDGSRPSATASGSVAGETRIE